MDNAREDFAEAISCIGCGAELWPDVDGSFASGPDTFLCFECAEDRGGVYDAAHDHWSTPPDVTGLVDERRPHT